MPYSELWQPFPFPHSDTQPKGLGIECIHWPAREAPQKKKETIQMWRQVYACQGFLHGRMVRRVRPYIATARRIPSIAGRAINWQQMNPLRRVRVMNITMQTTKNNKKNSYLLPTPNVYVTGKRQARWRVSTWERSHTDNNVTVWATSTETCQQSLLIMLS